MKKCGIVDPVVARKLYGEAMKESKLVHYKFPTKPSSDGYFHLWIVDETRKTGRRQVKARTLEELKEKVLNLHKVTFTKGIRMIVANTMLVLAVVVFYIFTFTMVPLLLIAQTDPSCLSTFEWAVTPIEKFVNIFGGSMFND